MKPPVPSARRRCGQTPRYPLAICPFCVLEAVDAKGHDVRFYNTSPMGGGFEARHGDGRRDEDHVCFARGIACRADEAYFGGIVVQVTGEKSPAR